MQFRVALSLTKESGETFFIMSAERMAPQCPFPEEALLGPRQTQAYLSLQVFFVFRKTLPLFVLHDYTSTAGIQRFSSNLR